MKTYARRSVLGLMIAAGIGLGVSSLSALKGEAYSPAAYQGLQASGTPFLIDFYATWCSTCRALVIMKGGDELGRLVAQTGKGKITELLDLAI